MPGEVTGGAAILAKLKARKAAATVPAQSDSTPASAAPPTTTPTVTKSSVPETKVTFAYASQTGTATEIARNLHADAVQRGIKADVQSLNELGFSNFDPQKVPLLVLFASSTGDGDPPDNASAFWLQLRKKQADGCLKGMKFTILGLGDSNYTRFMHMPRSLKNR